MLPAPDLTRLVYPYPYTAQYTGKGDVKDASSFVRGPAQPASPELFDWFGSGFYTTGYEKWCTGTGAVLNCKDSR
jgi:feruloyl esterase